MSINSASWYAFEFNSASSGTYQLLGSAGLVPQPQVNDSRSYLLSPRSFNFSYGDYLVLQLSLSTANSVLIDQSLSFSEQALVPSFDVDGYISSSGSVTIAPSNFSTSVNLYRLFDDGTGGFYVRRASNVQSYYQYDFTLPKTNIFLDTDSYHFTGNLYASSTVDYMSYAFLSVTYGDDDGLVDTVKNIDGTLTDMAGNLQTITDDFTAKQETAQDIGGVVSDTDISNNDATLSTGMDSLDQGIDSLNISDVSAPALSFSSFMTANAVTLLNFGNGVLYWALFALVILSVLLFIFRRLF